MSAIPLFPRGLFIVDGYTDSITHYIPNGNGDIALDTTDNRIYATGFVEGIGHIKVIDLTTNRIIDTINISEIIGHLFWNPLNNKVYTWGGIRGEGKIKVIDCLTNQIIWEYPEEYNERYIELKDVVWFSPLNRLYLLMDGKSKLIVIRDEIPGIGEVGNSEIFKGLEISPTIGASFKFSWRGEEEIKVGVYNALGRKVQEFKIKPESHLIWDGKDKKGNKLSSGVYFLKAKEMNCKLILK